MKLNRHFYIIVFLLGAVLIYINFLGAVDRVPLKCSLDHFPKKIANFTMINSKTFNDDVMEHLDVDNYLMWEYSDETGYRIWLYIGYFQNQTEGSIIHSPKHCMPGGGWNIISSDLVTITDSRSKTLKYGVNELVLKKGMDTQIAHYWYHSRGRIVANEYIDRALMILDSITKRRSDGALIRITGSGFDAEESIEKQIRFASALLGILDEYLPK